jgi:hypothetical protein
MTPSGAMRGGGSDPGWAFARALGLFTLTFTLASFARALLPALRDPGGPFLNDWVVFQRAAARAAAGGRADLYALSVEEGYPFAYPPALLELLAPLGRLAPGHFYALLSLASLLALGAALSLGTRAAGGGLRLVREASCLCAAGSAAALVTLVSGQLAAFHLLAGALGAWLWLRGRSFGAGLAWSLAAWKPTLALALPLFFLARRELPGPEPLEAWWRTLQEMGGLLSAERVQIAKNLGLRAFLELGLPGMDAGLRSALWIGAGALLSAAALRGWWRAPASLRAFGWGVLLTAAISPYLFLYDGLLLALPFLAFALEREGYRSPRLRRALGACWAALQIELFLLLFWPGPPPRTGLWIAAILLLELADAAPLPSRPNRSGVTLSP